MSPPSGQVEDTLPRRPYYTPADSGYVTGASADITSAYGALDTDFANLFDKFDRLAMRRSVRVSDDTSNAPSYTSPSRRGRLLIARGGEKTKAKGDL